MEKQDSLMFRKESAFIQVQEGKEKEVRDKRNKEARITFSNVE